jgi:HemY protein
MVWSLVKIVIFIALVAAATFGAGWVIEAGGEVRVSLGATEFSLTPLAGAAVLVLLLIAGWIAFRIAGLLVATIRFINGDETAISRYFDRNRERRGFEALADALMALASGEGRLAMTKAARAERYLARPELTLLLAAQAAEMSGETKRAQEYYKKLLGDDRTRFVGVQGILKQKLAEGDTDTALKLAEKAFALKPKHEKTLDTLFALQSDKADWKGARDTLSAKLKARVLPKDVHTRRDAVLALADAREKIEAGDLPAGSAAAFEANRLSPDLVPAAVLAAEMHVVNEAPKKAVAALKKAWGSQPHPDLAAAFAEIAPDETPDDRRARFQPLLKLKPEDPESRMLEAELAIAADDFPAARKAMGDLAETQPTTRSLTIMAAVERGEGSPDNVVRGFLARALSASRGPQWICSKCKHIHAAWAPVCEHCASFDTLAWEVPPAGAEMPSRSVDMLPLIVGTLEDKGATGDAPAPEPAEPPPEPVADDPAPEAATPKRKRIADRVAGLSDDMDGILGDPHTVPERTP